MYYIIEARSLISRRFFRPPFLVGTTQWSTCCWLAPAISASVENTRDGANMRLGIRNVICNLQANCFVSRRRIRSKEKWKSKRESGSRFLVDVRRNASIEWKVYLHFIFILFIFYLYTFSTSRARRINMKSSVVFGRHPIIIGSVTAADAAGQTFNNTGLLFNLVLRVEPSNQCTDRQSNSSH